MLTDKGFTHALATAVLKDNPKNPSALKLLAEPENKVVIKPGEVYDLFKKPEKEVKTEWAKQKLRRIQCQ